MRRLLLIIILSIPLNIFSYGSNFSFGNEIGGDSQYFRLGKQVYDSYVLTHDLFFRFENFKFSLHNKVFIDSEKDFRENTLGETRITFQFFLDKLNIKATIFSYKELDNTLDISLSFYYHLLSFISLYTEQSFDVWNDAGAYYGMAGLSFYSRLTTFFTISLYSEVEWASETFNEIWFPTEGYIEGESGELKTIGSGVSDIKVCSSIKLIPSELFYLKLYGCYVSAFGNEIKDWNDHYGLDNGGFYGGLTIGSHTSIHY